MNFQEKARTRKTQKHTKRKTHKNPCHYSKLENTNPILFHPNVLKIQKLVNCVIRSDEVLGYYLNQINSHPKYSTAPSLEIYRKLEPDDPHYIGPPDGFMHGLYYDLSHWHYVYHGHSIDSYNQQHQIQDSDNFCSTFALMYLLETHHLRPHYPLRKKAYYHNIRLACKFWIEELRLSSELKTIFEKRIQKTELTTDIHSLQEALKLFHWGKHHAEAFYPNYPFIHAFSKDT
jgi:hypothetical protein